MNKQVCCKYPEFIYMKAEYISVYIHTLLYDSICLELIEYEPM